MDRQWYSKNPTSPMKTNPMKPIRRNPTGSGAMGMGPMHRKHSSHPVDGDDKEFALKHGQCTSCNKATAHSLCAAHMVRSIRDMHSNPRQCNWQLDRSLHSICTGSGILSSRLTKRQTGLRTGWFAAHYQCQCVAHPLPSWIASAPASESGGKHPNTRGEAEKTKM